MEYNIKNKKLSQSVITSIENEANEKIVDLILTFAKQSNGVFYGEMRIDNYRDEVLDLGNQISEVDELLRKLSSKSDDELKTIASQYEVDGFESLDKDNLLIEVEKKLINKLGSLRKKTDEISSIYTRNNSNTFEYTMNKLSRTTKLLSYDERNINKKQSYEHISLKFNSIVETLNILHSWNDAISNDAWKIMSNQDEILDTRQLIDNNIDLCCNSTDDKQKEELSVRIDKDLQYVEDLNDEIDQCKLNLVELFAQNKIGTSFNALETKILNDLHDIEENIIEDISIDNGEIIINHALINKYITAYHQFFEELEYKEFNLKKYFFENGVEPIINKDNEKDCLENQLADAINRDMEAERIANEVVSSLEPSVNEEVQTPEEEVKEETEEVQEQTNSDVIDPFNMPAQASITDSYKYKVIGSKEATPDDIQKGKTKAKEAISLNKIFSKLFGSSDKSKVNEDLINELQGEGRSM